MGHFLIGLKEYLEQVYPVTVFDKAVADQKSYDLHLYGNRIARVKIKENLKYDIKAEVEGESEQVIPKIQIKLLYLSEMSSQIRPLIKTDSNVKNKGLQPIGVVKLRYHIKNKSLFPLMKEKEVVFFTLLEGEIVRGLILDFYRYEIDIHMKGGLPVTVLRHAIFDVRNKEGKCFLKTVQQKKRDWQASPLFVEQPKVEPKSKKPRVGMKHQPGKFKSKRFNKKPHKPAGNASDKPLM